MESIILTIAASLVSISGLVVCIVATRKNHDKRLIDPKTKKIYRVLYRGKDIEVKGRKFYVDTDSSYALATDEITGLGCGQRKDLESRIDKILENISKCNIPPLDTLPVGIYDLKTREVKPKEETEDAL